MNASELDWSTIGNFVPGEWPDGVLGYMDSAVITALQQVRSVLPDSHVIIPSPIARAHVRHEVSGSRHSTREGTRLSDATDFFMEWRHVWRAWMHAQRNPLIGGIGIYTDMLWAGQQGKLAMMHIDLREERLVWVAWRESPRHDMQYCYLINEPIRFHRLITERAHG